MGILHRYITRELLKVFLLALTAFTVIFVLVGLVQEATRQGIGLVQILALVPFVVPASLPYTIPVTLLLAVSVVYGRLAADNEIIATKAAGVNVLYVIRPALVLGLVLSIVTFWLYDRVIPASNLRLRAAIASNIEDVVYATLKRDKMIRQSGLAYELYTQEVEGKTLRNVTIKRKASDSDSDLMVNAETARLEFDLANRVVNVHMYKASVRERDSHLELFAEKVYPFGMPNIGEVKPQIRDMNIRDMAARRDEIERGQAKDRAMWAFNTSVCVATGHLEQLQAKWKALSDEVDREKNARRELRRLESEPYLRWAISFGCLFFVLLGCPVAILFQRGDYLSAFITCFLPIIAIYYPLVMLGMNLTKEGLATPLVLWGGNAMVGVLGLAVFRPVLRH